MIERIAIHNFKAFQYAEIGLTELNLFSGMNGMGKSTFIQSLLLLRQNTQNNNTNGLRNGLQLKGSLIDIGNGKDAQNIHAEDDILGFDIDFEDNIQLSVQYDLIAESDFLLCHTSKFEEANISNQSLFSKANFQYLNAERKSPSNTFLGSNSQVTQQRSLGKHGQYTVHFIAHNQREPLSNHYLVLDGVTNTLIDQIDAWYGRITPDTHLKATYFPDLDVAKLTYSFGLGTGSTGEFTPINVGFGFTYILPVITAVLAAKKGDLVIIENPESHLHPQGQAQLGELFAKAAAGGVQLIVETHSDHLLNGVRVAVKQQKIAAAKVSVFYFERDTNSTEHLTAIVQPVIDSDGRLSRQPKGFFDEYAKQLDQLIQ
jgi:predicted ATPase